VLEQGLLFFSLLLTLGAYGEYFLDLSAARIAPNRWSWLIWSATTIMEVATFYAIAGDAMTAFVFVSSAAGCVAITLAIWRRAAWRAPSATELFCVLASLAAAALWFIFRQDWWAHLLMLAAIPISFLPTLQSARGDYRREDSPSWLLWTIGDALALGYVLTRHEQAGELLYASVELTMHAGIWLLVLFGRRRGRVRARAGARA
jgi:hypothetical protein